MNGADARPLIGWDIGGAHLKAALLDRDGRVCAVEVECCPLWQGIGHLDVALDAIEARLAPPGGALHRLTMTGELVDCFESRRAGCRAIVDCVVAGRRWGRDARWFADDGRLLDAVEAIDRWHAVVSANWRASAGWIARGGEAALMVDLGSTTADLVAVGDGRLRTTGRDDGSRLASDELVYTGLTRTPLMALADRAPFGGASVGLMAEHFATTADIHRVLGELDERCDLHPAADGGVKTATASARRLARMVGRDLEDAAWEDWVALAAWFAQRQRDRLAAAITRVAGDQGLPSTAPLVVAGIGRGLVTKVARELGRPWRPFHHTMLHPPRDAALAAAIDEQAPAIAVALAGSDAATISTAHRRNVD